MRFPISGTTPPQTGSGHHLQLCIPVRISTNDVLNRYGYYPLPPAKVELRGTQREATWSSTRHWLAIGGTGKYQVWRGRP